MMSVVMEQQQRRARGSNSSPNAYFPSPLTEGDLSRLWLDQTFPADALVSESGERLRVIYRGRPGRAPGQTSGTP
jgi:hypothetical protein